jgi:TANFOR domain-containing protein
LTVIAVKAQDPVQITAQLLPPYSTTVSDYFSADKLKLMLLNRDVSRPSITVRLRMTIESQSVKIRTREDQSANFQTFALVNGSPYFVQATELTSYFNGDHLDFTGALSQQDYMQTGKLPEGLYSFCFEAVEVNTGLVVSRKTCAFAWMTLSDPPLLNLPANNGIIPAINPQNVVFNWTPRHTASPNAAFQVNYVISIVEVSKESEDFETTSGQQAFLSYPVLYTEQTSATSFIIDVSKIQLQEGSKYFWRVQAVTDNGTAAFRNDGYSEIFAFIYINDCPEINNPTAIPYGTRAIINWIGDSRHLEFKVQFREKNNPIAEWFSVTTPNHTVSISDLKANTDYEYQIAGACEYGKFIFANVYEFQTLDSAVTTVPNCGDSSLIPKSVSAASLITTLVPGSNFKAGDFTIYIITVAGTNVFSGTAYTEVPWLANIKVAVKFTNVQINTANQLVSGLIETEFDPSAAGIDDVDETLDAFIGGYNIGNVVTGVATADYPINGNVSSTNNFTVTPGSGYSTATGTGSMVTINIKDDNGNPIDPSIKTDTLPKTFIDKNGNIYQVGKDLQVVKVGNAGGSSIIATMNKKNIDIAKGTVKFVHHPNEAYAFDEFRTEYKKSNAFLKEYERIGDYYVSAKAIAPGKTDVLKAEIILTSGAGFNDKDVQFINGKGTIYTSTSLGGGFFEISIVGGPERDAQEIYAVYKDPNVNGKTYNLGKVLVASYPAREYKVKFIPVGTAAVNSQVISQGLNTTYNNLNVSFKVAVDQNFTDQSWDANNNGLEVRGSGKFSVYTNEMKALNDAYKKSRNVEKDVFYIFVLNSASDSAVFGDMPRGKQFGYLFTQGNNNQDIVTAHEVGHGIFKLKHIFDIGGFDETSLPDNLMQYQNGTALTKHQWDFVHDPAVVFGFFEEDDDAQYNAIRDITVLKKFKNPTSESFSFYNPDGEIVTLSSNIKAVYFSTGDLYYRAGTSKYVPNPNDIAMVGSLAGFVDNNGKEWLHTVTTKIPGSNLQQRGYKDSAGALFVMPSQFNSAAKLPIIGRPCYKDGKAKFQVVNVLNVNEIIVTDKNTFQNVDLLNDYFLNNYTRCDYIDLRLNSLSQSAMEYIAQNSKAASYDKPYATYIFGLANLISNFPNVHRFCNAASDDGFDAYSAHLDTTITDIQEKKKSLLEYYRKYFDLYPASFNNDSEATLYAIRSGCGALSNSLPVALAFAGKASCVANTIVRLSELHCLLQGLTWVDRKDILDMLINTGTGTFGISSNVSKSISTLCSTAPPSQYDNILSYFNSGNNYEQLYIVYDLLESNDKTIFASTIAGILKSKYSEASNAVKTLQLDPLSISSETARLASVNIPLWNTNTLSDCNGILQSIPGPIPADFVSTFLLGCRELHASMDPISGVIEIISTIKHLGKRLDWRILGDPYTTWVNVHFLTDFNYAGISKGNIMQVPLFYLYHLVKQHDAVLSGQTLRIALNAAAILGATVSGGASLSALGVINAVTIVGSSIDIVMTVNEDKLRGTAEGRKFLELYNNVQHIIGYAMLLPIAGTIGRELSFGFSETRIGALSLAKYGELKQSIAKLLAESKALSNEAISASKLLALKLCMEYQIARTDLSRCIKNLLPGSSVATTTGNVWFKVPNLSSEIKIAEYRFLDDNLYFVINREKAIWVSNATAVEQITENAINYKRVGSLENSSYYASEAEKGEGTLDFYQSVNEPNKIYVVKRTASAIISTENLPSTVRQLISKPSYKPFRTIFSKKDKTTTFIGKWNEVVSGEQKGLQTVFTELSESDLNIYMQSGKLDHPSGFNMLSIDNLSLKQAEYVQKLNSGQISNLWSFDEYIWQVYNKPWLESALQRGDEIVIWSDPLNSRTGFYKRELDFIESKASLYGYDYNSGINLGTFSK